MSKTPTSTNILEFESTFEEKVKAFADSLQPWVEEAQDDENRVEAHARMVDAFRNSSATLDLRNLKLRSIPDQIGALVELNYLDLAGNKLTTLPDRIGDLVELRALYLESNKLTTLPDRTGDLRKLDIVYIQENSLTTLPESLLKIHKLSISAQFNPFTAEEIKRIRSFSTKDRKILTSDPIPSSGAAATGAGRIPGTNPSGATVEKDSSRSHERK